MRIPGWALTHIADVAPYEGETATGPKYGTSFSISCRFQQSLSRKRDGTRTVNVNRGVIYCDPEHTIPRSSKITADGRSWVVSEVVKREGLGAPSHLEVHLEAA